MTSDLGIWRGTHALIRQPGDGDGAWVRRRIVAAINEIQREEPATGERRH